jgi:hypothetical protein
MGGTVFEEMQLDHINIGKNLLSQTVRMLDRFIMSHSVPGIPDMPNRHS